jgi:hypothetical protein
LRRAPPRLPLWREAALASVSQSSAADGSRAPSRGIPPFPTQRFSDLPHLFWGGSKTVYEKIVRSGSARDGPRTPLFPTGPKPSTVARRGYPPFFDVFHHFCQKTRKNTFFHQKTPKKRHFLTFFHVFSRFLRFFPKNAGFKKPRFLGGVQKPQKWPKNPKNGGLPPPP